MSLTHRQKRIILWSVLGVLVVLILLIVGTRFFLEYKLKQQNLEAIPNGQSLTEFLLSAKNKIELPEIQLPTTKKSVFDGTEIPLETDERVVAVVIENFPTSRPQMHGLPEASVVFEALAEGGITRYLAFFPYQNLKKVGPVRSARPYFVAWADERSEAIVHAGGSPDGLKRIYNSDLQDFDEDGKILFRDYNFEKPHNLFVDLDSLRQKLFPLPPEKIGSWFAIGESPADAEEIDSVAINFSHEPSYNSKFVWNAADQNFEHFLAGFAHADADGVRVTPKNLAVVFTSFWPIDDAGRLEMKTTGEGEAWFFSGGKMWEGSWRKLGEKTEFLDAAGKTVEFAPGQTWIAVTDSPARVKIEKPVSAVVPQN